MARWSRDRGLGTDPGRGWLWEKELQCLKRCVASVYRAWLAQVGWGVGVSRCKEARSPRGGSIWSQAVLWGGGPGSQSAVSNRQTCRPPHQEGKGPGVQARFPIQAPAEAGKLEFRWALEESVSAGIPELILQQVLDTICGLG